MWDQFDSNIDSDASPSQSNLPPEQDLLKSSSFTLNNSREVSDDQSNAGLEHVSPAVSTFTRTRPLYLTPGYKRKFWYLSPEEWQVVPEYPSNHTKKQQESDQVQEPDSSRLLDTGAFDVSDSLDRLKLTSSTSSKKDWKKLLLSENLEDIEKMLERLTEQLKIQD